jgi:hypothetical protein
MRLTGFTAIEFAEKHNLRLRKHPDQREGPRDGLSIAEAEAIADEDESLIFLEVAEAEYDTAGPTTLEPDR